MPVLETPRLELEQLNEQDAPFILQLVNEQGWLRYIGDRGVRSVEDARQYLEKGPIASYAQFGFGLYAVRRRGSATAMGICGLIRRGGLPDPDIGFAFLEAYCGKGYAFEAAEAVLGYAHTTLGISRILAIVVPENTASIKLLEKLGMQFQELVRLPGSTEDCRLYTSA